MSSILHNMIGSSPPMTEVFRLIELAARTDATVLIRGESGTGKELVAQAIHANSGRKSGPFVPVNCAALSESLAESELFGHEKGAFTGAVAQKKGEFELASGGTLFLDEIGELPPAIQPKMLRALQEREIKRVGGGAATHVNIRIIAATNRDLDSGFRPDLYYRLNVFPIWTPPLRERREDIPALAQRFVSIFSTQYNRALRGISTAAERMLQSYDWPGNVRELQNAIERAVTMASTEFVLPGDLPALTVEKTMNVLPLPVPAALNLQQNLDATKRDVLERAFAAAKGHHNDASTLMGLNPNYVYTLLKKLDMPHLRRKSQPI